VSTESGIKNRTNGFLVGSSIEWLLSMLRPYDMWLVGNLHRSCALSAVGHLKAVKNSNDVADSIDGN